MLKLVDDENVYVLGMAWEGKFMTTAVVQDSDG